MFDPALMLLIRMQWRGGFRQFRKSLRTFRGLFQLAFVIVMLLYGAVSMYFVGMVQSVPSALPGPFGSISNDLLSLGLFVATSCIVLFSAGEASVYFTASEVAFLFPAPVTRKQLLTYKLLKSLMGIIGISVVFMFLSPSRIQTSLFRFAGTVLTIGFLQLLTMNVAFARQILQEKMHLWIRRVLGTILGLVVLIAANHIMPSAAAGDWAAIVKAFHSSVVGQCLLAPFSIFVTMLRTTDLISFLIAFAIVLVIDGSLLFLAYRLDALSLEAAFAISEKVTARLKLMQSKGVWSALGTPTSKVARRRLAPLPFWAGIGPVVWQRMTTTFRASTQLFWLLGAAILVAGGIVYAISNAKQGDTVAPFFGIGAMGYMSLLVCLTLQNDIERVGFLKSLPLRTVSIVLGEMLGFVMFLSTTQLLFMAVLMSCFPQQVLWVFCAMVLTIPLNFLLFAVDKLVFYIYPTRMAKGAPGDFQNSGKQMIFIALKMSILGGCLLVTGLSTLPAALLLQSPLAAVGSFAGVLLIECVAIVPLLSLAFDRFDPGVTMVS